MKAEIQVADQITIRENKLSLVERLADDLAHEIKNPLHAMVINLEVLRRRIARLDDDRSQDLLRYAGVINDELERVNRRIDLLLRTVRPYRETEDTASLGEILDELGELVELRSERRGIDVVLEPPKELINLPRAPARQLILSLILKTLDSLESGGSLTVTPATEGNIVRVRFEGRMPAGGNAFPAATGDPKDDANAGRILAESMGGDLQPIATAESGTGGSYAGYVLTLPRPG